MFRLDTSGAVTYADPDWLSLTGETLEQLQRHWRAEIHPADRSLVSCKVRAAVSCEERLSIGCRRRIGSGCWWVMVRVWPLRARDTREVLEYAASVTLDRPAQEELPRWRRRRRLPDSEETNPMLRSGTGLA